MRIGQGFDLHLLAEGRPLVLGGVGIPFPRGLEGHSDADALLHAVIDAVLGALSMGNIGLHFPTGDPKWRGASSMDLLSRVVEMMREKGFHLSNLDSTIYADEPTLSPWLETMAAKIALGMGARREQVSVKAKSLEGLTAHLPRPLIAASALVALEEDEPAP